MYFRNSEQNLQKWYESKRSKPLVIRGARQVGKTTLVRSFCQKNNINLLEVNFEEMIVESFKSKNFSIDNVIQEIEVLTNKKLTKDSILFIDEIQVIPKAYQALRFFKEQRPDIKVIAAGSLLEMTLKQEKISTPVGRIEFLYLYPMSFDEFLLARGSSQLTDVIKKKKTFSESLHLKLLGHLNEYFYIGGMPEAVSLFIEEKSYLGIRKVHMDIIESYRQDIRKYYKGNNKNILLEVFDAVFLNVGEKVKYTKFSKVKSTIVAECLNVLNDLFLIHKIVHSNCSGLPIKFGENSDYYKVFFIDIGLLNSVSKTPWKKWNESQLNELVNKGIMAEQFVAQELISHNSSIKSKLHYWLKDKNPKKSEVDFVVDIDESVMAIEVKSGKTGTVKSLIQFMGEKQKLKPIAIKLDLKYREDFEQEFSSYYFTKEGKKPVTFNLRKYPLYMSKFVLNG